MVFDEAEEFVSDKIEEICSQEKLSCVFSVNVLLLAFLI